MNLGFPQPKNLALDGVMALNRLKVKRSGGKHHTIYLANLKKGMVEQGLEKIEKKQDIKSYKGWKIVGSHESQYPEIDT